MKIEHIAIWTRDIERLKKFYSTYFAGIAGEKYCNPNKHFESYFISFDSGARIELMQIPILLDSRGGHEQYIGWAHVAFSLGDKAAVDILTEVLRNAGYEVVSEPRYTGDGYYESCILDPDGNKVELTE